MQLIRISMKSNTCNNKTNRNTVVIEVALLKYSRILKYRVKEMSCFQLISVIKSNYL